MILNYNIIFLILSLDISLYYIIHFKINTFFFNFILEQTICNFNLQ